MCLLSHFSDQQNMVWCRKKIVRQYAPSCTVVHFETFCEGFSFFVRTIKICIRVGIIQCTNRRITVSDNKSIRFLDKKGCSSPFHIKLYLYKIISRKKFQVLAALMVCCIVLFIRRSLIFDICRLF